MLETSLYFSWAVWIWSFQCPGRGAWCTRLALLGKKQIAWRFICAGLGYGHCRVWESLWHPWISPLPLFVVLPYPFLFSLRASKLFLFLIGGEWWSHSGWTTQEKTIKQEKGLIQWETFAFWNSFNRFIFLPHWILCILKWWLCVQVRVHTHYRTQRFKSITRLNPFLSGIIQRISLAHSMQQTYWLYVCVSVTAGTNKPTYWSL